MVGWSNFFEVQNWKPHLANILTIIRVDFIAKSNSRQIFCLQISKTQLFVKPFLLTQSSQWTSGWYRYELHSSLFDKWKQHDRRWHSDECEWDPLSNGPAWWKGCHWGTCCEWVRLSLLVDGEHRLCEWLCNDQHQSSVNFCDHACRSM